MRVVVAPDSFGELLSAADAAAAIAAGWRTVGADDDLDLAPMSDGGPGFVAALHAALGGSLRTATVTGPMGERVAASYLLVGRTAYVEAAQAIGLQLVAVGARDPRTASSAGLGELVSVAAADADTVVVGLGGTVTNDGGAGLWAGLGAEPGAVLAAGPLPLDPIVGLQPPPRPAVSLVVATDVDNPLLGPNGASAVFGPQKGADRAAVLDLDDALRRWADLVERVVGRDGLRDAVGAGAGGGCGFALLALGAERRGGVDLVAETNALSDRIADADLVVTGEGAFDSTSLRGKVVAGVAALARAAAVPCVVIAGRVEVGRRDAAAAGIDEAYAVADLFESAEAALAAGAEGITAAAARAARAWGSVGGRG
jgi:glycerate kinase